MTFSDQPRHIEWPTLGLILLCSVSVPLLTLFSAALSLWVSVPALTVILALHSSIQHEVLHGHPFKSSMLNEAVVFIPAGLFLPYRRFRDTHLQHHNDSALTDPYDDPETNFQDPDVWAKMNKGLRFILAVNNSLAGRMIVGPLISFYVFYKSDLEAILSKDRAVINAYSLHIIGLVPFVILLVIFSTMPFWAYLISAYAAVSLLKVRTYLEHRAHDDCTARTVIIEDRGFFALLFLNNNFHSVHHAYPKMEWYNLPAAFYADRDGYLARNDGYTYQNYRTIFRQYFLRNKDQVPHPLWKNQEQE